MKLDEIIFFESPQMVGPTNFALDNPAQNSAMAKSLLKKMVETIDETPNYILFRTGDDYNGNIALVNKTNNTLGYLVHYRQARYGFLGTTVTQLKLWRNLAEPHAIGVTSKIFFDYLLKKYPAILSDGMQTEYGKRFWITRMGEATLSGYKVGLANLNTNTVIWYDGQDYQTWIQDNDGWDNAEASQALRYIIAN